MIQHIVLLKWKPGTSDQQVDGAFGQLRELVEGIPAVDRITFGRNRGGQDHGFSHAIIVRLADEGGLRSFLGNPVRRHYVEEVLGPIEADRIEMDLPDDVHLERNASPEFSWDWAGTRPSAAAAAAALRWEESHPDA